MIADHAGQHELRTQGGQMSAYGAELILVSPKTAMEGAERDLAAKMQRTKGGARVPGSFRQPS